MHIYVGIVTYNSRNDLPACLNALRQQTELPLSIIAFDNASQDGSAEYIRRYAAEVLLICNQTNVGYGCAHNRILRQCSPDPDDYYLPLNPDASLCPRYIFHLITVLEQTGAGWATGKLYLTDQPTHFYSVGHGLRRDGYMFNIAYGLEDVGQFNTPREIFGAPGVAPLISGKLLHDLAPDGNLFDPAMFLYGEDSDFDWRARRAGWRCWYTPDAVATHRGSQNVPPHLRAQALGNRYISVLKNAFWLDLLTYNLPVIILHCLIRLLITPYSGWQIIKQLLRFGPSALTSRTAPHITHAGFAHWWHWSAVQPTQQPVSWRARVHAFNHSR